MATSFSGEVFKIILSSVLIYGFGSLLNSQIQTQYWDRQVRYELLSNKIVKDNAVLDEVTSAINERLFASKQFIWSVRDSKDASLSESWNQYYETVIQWNNKSELLQSRLLQMAGAETAAQFLTYEDDLNLDIPNSIHYKFYKIHQLLLHIKGCYYSGCNIRQDFYQLDKLIGALTEQETILVGKLNGGITKTNNLLLKSPSNYFK
jgi:hypothetical protein